MIMKSVLFVAPLPPPLTGQSIAVARLYEHIKASADVYMCDMSKTSFVSGVASMQRLIFVVKSLFRISSFARKVDKIYFNCAQSVAGNLRDLLIYAICWKQLPNMVIHLHGGAGMRVLLSDRHPILRSLNRLFLQRVGAVVVLGESLRGIYDGVASPKAVYAVSNFAEDEYFCDEAMVVSKFDAPKKIRLLFLSNLIPGKGHIELLQALTLLPKPVKNMIQVDFAGGFESYAAEAQFKKGVNQITDVTINLHGVVRGGQKKQLLLNAHLFCLPTYYAYEGQPISILEAYASGCAVMTTDHSGIFDIFTPGVNGIEVEKKSVQSIADGIIQSVENVENLIDFALANLKEANEKYRFSSHSKILDELILN